MNRAERAAAVIECQQALNRFYAALDAGDFETVSASMAPQGVWHRQGQQLCGPAQVREALAKRPAGRVTAHLVQNLVVNVTAPDLAEATYMTLVYRVDLPQPAAGPVPLETPFAISLNRARLQGDASGVWRLLDQRSEYVFSK